jgi:ribosomal protein S27E
MKDDERETPCRDCGVLCWYEQGDRMVRCFVCGAYFAAPPEPENKSKT